MSICNKGAYFTNGHFFTHPVLTNWLSYPNSRDAIVDQGWPSLKQSHLVYFWSCSEYVPTISHWLILTCLIHFLTYQNFQETSLPNGKVPGSSTTPWFLKYPKLLVMYQYTMMKTNAKKRTISTNIICFNLHAFSLI